MTEPTCLGSFLKKGQNSTILSFDLVLIAFCFKHDKRHQTDWKKITNFITFLNKAYGSRVHVIDSTESLQTCLQMYYFPFCFLRNSNTPILKSFFFYLQYLLPLEIFSCTVTLEHLLLIAMKKWSIPYTMSTGKIYHSNSRDTLLLWWLMLNDQLTIMASELLFWIWALSPRQVNFQLKKNIIFHWNFRFYWFSVYEGYVFVLHGL